MDEEVPEMVSLEHSASTSSRLVPERENLEGILECLHQIMRKLPTMKETVDDTAMERKVLDDFFECIWKLDCKNLLSMIEKHSQLVVKVGNQGRTALHVAVISNSAELVEKLLQIAFCDGNRPGPRASQLVDAIDKELQLNALEIANIIGNEKIVGLLWVAGNCLKFKIPFYLATNLGGNVTPERVGKISEGEEALSGSGAHNTHGAPGDSLEGRLQQIRSRLEPIMGDVLIDGMPRTLRQLNKAYKFSGNEFILHAAVGCLWSGERPKLVEKICGALVGPGSSRLLATIFQEVRDKQGRTPLHVLVDQERFQPSDIGDCIGVLRLHCIDFDINNVRDFAGRTPLHWAAARGNSSMQVKELLKIDGIDLNAHSSRNLRVGDSTALHLAVMHNHTKVVETLLIYGCDINSICYRPSEVNGKFVEGFYNWTPFQVAAMKGHAHCLQILLKDPKLYDSGMLNPFKKPEDHNGIPALHLAATSGNPLAVKVLLDNRKINAFALDQDNNTALHYAAAFDLQDFVSVHHFVSVSHYSERRTMKEKRVGGIIGCMDLLIQAGLDMGHRNIFGTTPELGPSSSGELERWWYERMVKQAQETKSNLVAASNAISVTAALVATASFVGPLQPPLGLSTSTEEWLTGYSQVNHTAVEVFLFCDNLSFYLAIASIMLAVIPSLAIPEEGLSLEVGIAGRSVQASVGLLFASITFVVCAFSAASIAIVPETRWKYKGLIIASTSVGTLVCLVALGLFSLRLLRLIKPKNTVIRRLNDALSILYRRENVGS